MGSVKDLDVTKKPTKDATGIGQFRFSDRYSVFDWGEMPDHIEGKGEALCLMGAYCFERLEQEGIKTHYRGLITEKGETTSFDKLKKPTNTMEVKLVNVYRPRIYAEKGRLQYNYDAFSTSLKNYLIPLEIIYRNGLPEGSSIFRRLEQGVITIAELGLEHYPKPGEHLAHPIFDVSTKLEEKDRYVTWREAQRIAGLTDEELEEIKGLLLKVDKTISQLASRAGLQNEDGKIELAFDHVRKLMIVDVVGTLDECRFTYDGLQVSKEIARQFYRKTEWFKDVEEAKRKAEETGIQDWKAICKSNPPKLEPALKDIISEMYKAAANKFTESRLFDAPSLDETVKKCRKYAGSV